MKKEYEGIKNKTNTKKGIGTRSKEEEQISVT
jgi:hypothetical protein